MAKSNEENESLAWEWVFVLLWLVLFWGGGGLLLRMR